MNFASVEELYFNQGYLREEGARTIVLESISAQLRFPKLHTLSIYTFRWHDWWVFLAAHSQTLKILSLTTYGESSSSFNEKIEFSALECFYMDYNDSNHTIVAGNVTRVGWHWVGYADAASDRMSPEVDKPKILRYLLSMFDYWLNFPAAATYSISGWPYLLGWLEEQPEVIEYVSKQDKWCACEVHASGGKEFLRTRIDF